MAVYKVLTCRMCPATFMAVDWIACRVDGFCSPLCQIESGKPKLKTVRELKGGMFADRHGRKFERDNDAPVDGEASTSEAQQALI